MSLYTNLNLSQQKCCMHNGFFFCIDFSFRRVSNTAGFGVFIQFNPFQFSVLSMENLDTIRLSNEDRKISWTTEP